MKNVKRARQALHDNQQAWNSTMHRGKEELRQEPEEEIVTLYTLAPASLDKPGTLDVGGYWLYSDDNVPEQVLREVLVDKESSVAQLQAYRLKIPYITFSEEGLQKALVKGLVYRADNGVSGVAFDPIKAAIENAKKAEDTTNPIVAAIDATIAEVEEALKQTEEKITMAKKPVVKASVATKPVATITEVEHAGMPKPVTPQVPTTERTPLGVAPVTKAPARIAIVIKDEPETPETPACSALDAILAAPIAQPSKKHLPLPKERTEDAIVAGINPDYAMNAAMYKAFVQAFRQALAEEGLVIVRMEHAAGMAGCGEGEKEAPVPHDPTWDAWSALMDVPQEVVPVDPVGDAWSSIMDAPKVPAKAKSTLVLGPNVGKAPKAPVQDIPGNHGKVPVDTIIAIQTAWKNKTATQAELAARYGITDKAVWYLVHRAKQYV